MKLQGFDYLDVKLTDSHWKHQRDETVELYLEHLDNNDVLHRDRVKAGIPSRVTGMAGWGPSIGQYLGAYAKLYRATGDERVREKALELFRGWAECADKEPKVLDHGTYPYEKFVGGLMDLYEYMGVEEAGKYVSLLTDHAMTNYDQSIDRDGLQDGRMKGQIEWYTLPENLYRAYQLLGDEKYKEFADAWRYDYLWDKLLAGDTDIGPRHAYSQVNSLSSTLREYMVTGDEKFLNVAIAAYDEITKHHTYATGGYGPAEVLFGDNPGYLGDALLSPYDFAKHPEKITYTNFAGQVVSRSEAWGSCEVSCCSWAVFKLCHYLIRLTGEARFGNWAERMLINGTGGQIPITEQGKVLYYANYFVDGAIKSVEDRRLFHTGQNHYWQCCTGTFPQDVAEYANMLYYRAEDALCVSQYLPSMVETSFHGVSVRVDQVSKFPDEPRVMIEIHADAPVEFALKLRVPGWATSGNRVFVNDEAQDVPVKPDDWVELKRIWREGDRVRMEVPFALRFEAVDREHPHIAALCYGPLVLSATEMTMLVGDIEKPEEWIVPVEGAFATFETLPGHSGPYDFLRRRFVPYYRIGAMEWYYMYNRVFKDKDALKHRVYGEG